MARPLRLEYPGAVYHLTARGNARHAIYRDDHDRHLFLEVLGAVSARYQWRCYAYCLMPNHYHLLVEPPQGRLSAGMRQWRLYPTLYKGIRDVAALVALRWRQQVQRRQQVGEGLEKPLMPQRPLKPYVP